MDFFKRLLLAFLMLRQGTDRFSDVLIVQQETTTITLDNFGSSHLHEKSSKKLMAFDELSFSSTKT